MCVTACPLFWENIKCQVGGVGRNRFQRLCLPGDFTFSLARQSLAYGGFFSLVVAVFVVIQYYALYQQ